MGAGLSLSHKQVVNLIERDLINLFEQEENMRPRTTDDGYEIYYDFSEEVKLTNKIKKLQQFLENEKEIKQINQINQINSISNYENKYKK